MQLYHFPRFKFVLLLSIFQAESKNDDKDDHPTTVVLISSKDKWLLSQDICLACGAVGKDTPLIPCAQCGQCYHTYCAGVERISMTMATKGWRCLDCTICEGCGKTSDEERLILCDDCDISYHTYCLNPPLDEVPKVGGLVVSQAWFRCALDVPRTLV